MRQLGVALPAAGAAAHGPTPSGRDNLTPPAPSYGPPPSGRLLRPAFCHALPRKLAYDSVEHIRARAVAAGPEGDLGDTGAG